MCGSDHGAGRYVIGDEGDPGGDAGIRSTLQQTEVVVCDVCGGDA